MSQWIEDAPPSAGGDAYPARLRIDYPGDSGLQFNRVTTLFRIVLVIPIAIVLGILAGGASGSTQDAQAGSIGIAGSLFFVTLLMLLFRRKYPRWWFDFALELNRFSNRVGAYLALLTDEYPSTTDAQRVHLALDYPDAERLNRWLPLVKWFLVIPHFVILVFLSIGAFFAVVIAWFAIVITGNYPRVLFDYVVGVFRWGLRVQAYALLLITDRYPPFSLR